MRKEIKLEAVYLLSHVILLGKHNCSLYFPGEKTIAERGCLTCPIPHS